MSAKVGVLVSGTGTNLQALIDRVHGRDGVDIVAVGSNQPDAPALQRAQKAGIETGTFPLDHYANREQRDLAIVEWLKGKDVTLVVLAGYMQLVTPAFLNAFPQRVVNVHPTLLPAFPGIRSLQQAIDYGVQVVGVTVHLVDEGVDSGPILLQKAIPMPPDPTDAKVRDAIRPLEHELLTRAVRLLANDQVTFAGRHAKIASTGGLDPVQIAAPPNEEEAARRFYGDILELTEIPKPESMLASGGVWFALSQGELHIGVEQDFRPARKAHPGIRVGDVATVERLAAKLDDVEWDDRYPGHVRFYTHDPWGNRVEVLAAGSREP